MTFLNSVKEGNSFEARCCPGYIGENQFLSTDRMFNLQMNYNPFYFQKLYDLKCERK